jgi:hypothetical protein
VQVAELVGDHAKLVLVRARQCRGKEFNLVKNRVN